MINVRFNVFDDTKDFNALKSINVDFIWNQSLQFCFTISLYNIVQCFHFGAVSLDTVSKSRNWVYDREGIIFLSRIYSLHILLQNQHLLISWLPLFNVSINLILSDNSYSIFGFVKHLLTKFLSYFLQNCLVNFFKFFSGSKKIFEFTSDNNHFFWKSEGIILKLHEQLGTDWLFLSRFSP